MKFVLAASVSLSALAMAGCEDSAMASVHYVDHHRGHSEGGFHYDQDGDVSLMGSELSVSGRIGGDLSLIGSELDVEADIGGRLSLVGSDITFDGSVHNSASIAGSDVQWVGHAGGSIDIAGSDVSWTGSTDGSLSIAGSDIEVAGSIAQGLDAAGSDISLSRASAVAGNVVLAGSDITLMGQIGGRAEISGSAVDFLGGVEGFVLVSAYPDRTFSWPRDHNHGRVRVDGELNSGGAICARSVVFDQGAQIGAPLYVYADDAPENAPSNVTFEAVDGRDCDDLLEQYEQ